MTDHTEGTGSLSTAVQKLRIYVASSWRNQNQPTTVEVLRGLGHEVYDFRNPRPGDTGFAWSEIDPDWLGWNPRVFRDLLDHDVAVSGFESDFAAMLWADTFVLELPCGRSAHLEAGWAIGQGKPVAILLREEGFEPELMYRMAATVVCDYHELFKWLGSITSGLAAAETGPSDLPGGSR
jgi:hypothetical protein